MKKTSQKGFTLVELAIVLVIIGIILGAVLKGQQLIFNAKVKRLQNQVKEMQAALYTYYDKYGYYPGDDPSASARWSVGVGDGDGVIEGGTCTDSTEESCLIWRHLRFADIISGDPNDTNPSTMTPHHIFGGYLHLYYATYGGKTSHWVVLIHLPGEAAAAIDRALDDGRCDGGSVVRISGTSCSGSDYQSNGTYNIAISI